MAISANSSKSGNWKRRELWFLVIYAIVFYVIIINRSLQLSRDYYKQLSGLRPGWLLANHLNDVSDAQWRNFRGNIPVLTLVFGIFTLLAYLMKAFFDLRVRGMSIVWLLFSLAYLSYLHGACIVFILSIATGNFILVKIFAQKEYFPLIVWSYNILFLLCNRIYEGYSFSIFGQQWAFLENYRGSFRWHICFNFVVLRMISFGFDYHWTNRDSHFDQEERSLPNDRFGYITYLSYLVYAPLYIAGPILSFNAFASQLDVPQNAISVRNVILYGFRWMLSIILMELMTHLCYYNAFAKSDLWKHLSPMDVFIIGYGVLNFMWLKFLLIWRFFRFWSLINGIEAPENMPKCINNCHNLEGFWKNWHASFNKWLVRYIYIPLGGSKKKLLNVWVIFTFVAIWHDLEWKLLSWAWLTCLFFIPELVFKSAGKTFQAQSSFGVCIFRELSAVAGAVTITCLMVANLVGFVVGPGGINWLLSSFLHKEGLPVLGGMLVTFYVGTKIMFHIDEAKQRLS
ncbi:membrane-bound O-acyltransferase gup1 isoform X2 [Vigna angularis]|uniref:membrane-bound O-acyltransferase gup1 isoform X2 n=1 Tax=Phaseolus angularis TaxID=3914 RepID=UPI0022B4438A|nr:membrane-bound O-acyltransferase gup1 isoform X2 [Vigna angularis]